MAKLFNFFRDMWNNPLRPKLFRVAIFVISLIMILVVMQFYRPVIKKERVLSNLTAPPEVASIFMRSCYDCHSYQSNLRWYDQIAPVYWQVAQDINNARACLNFSTWNSLPKAEQQAKLWGCLNQVHLGAMPLKAYLYIHPSAKLSSSEINALKLYLNAMLIDSKTDTSKISAYLKQRAWQKAHFGITGTPVALNGVAYLHEYKNWQVISTNERYDNGTIRFVYANPVAVNAIENRQINPWPDGAAFAKVAWDQLGDKAHTTAGAFKQIEFMIKDSRKYANTLGWGWARFKTTKLVPYGKSALFTNECMNCHRPMKNNDFVFTPPVIR